MSNPSVDPKNIHGTDMVHLMLKLFGQTLKIVVDRDNVAVRKERAVNSGDVLFNIVKLLFLERVLLKFRQPVRFGDSVVLDSTYPPFPSIAFSKRFANYINHLDMTEIPSGIVSLSTTNSCPYSCVFCSTNAKKKTQDDLDEDLLKRTIRQVESLGVPSIILHGGEPMSRYDRFLRLVKHVSDDTCLWTFTTGWGVTPERARELKQNGLFGAWVSLDHFDPDIHNGLRGHPKAFDTACRAVKHLKDAGIYTCLSLVPPPEFSVRENFLRYYDLAKDLGVAEIRIMEMKPSGREACKGVIPHSPELEQLQKDLYQDPAYRNHPPISGLSTWLEKDPAVGCQCRFEYLFITSTGELQPCEATEISFGNIQEEEFLTIYDRARKAFPHPSTGCIPMVMYPEVREYQKTKHRISSAERAEKALRIMEKFQARGSIPGAFKRFWPLYEERLQKHRRRKAGTVALRTRDRSAVTGV